MGWMDGDLVVGRAGLTHGQISAHCRGVRGGASGQTISTITDRVLDAIGAGTPLDPVYPVISLPTHQREDPRGNGGPRTDPSAAPSGWSTAPGNIRVRAVVAATVRARALAAGVVRVSRTAAPATARSCVTGPRAAGRVGQVWAGHDHPPASFTRSETLQIRPRGRLGGGSRRTRFQVHGAAGGRGGTGPPSSATPKRKYPAIVRLWDQCVGRTVPFLQFDLGNPHRDRTTNAIESINV